VQALAYWKTVTADSAGFLDRILEVLASSGARYCVIGGQGVNGYVEPVVSLDLDIAVATDDLPRVEALLRKHFRVEPFPHSLNVSMEGSDLRVQLQTDPRYSEFVARAQPRPVLGLTLPVAAVDPKRRPSKRQKDLADIARLLEAYPDLRAQVPADLLARLV